MKKLKNKYIIVYSTLILVLLLVCGATYAYFSPIFREGHDTVVVEAKTLRIAYVDGPELIKTGFLPGATIVKTFSVKNTGTDAIYYSIAMLDVINELNAKSDLIYELTGDNGLEITNELFPSNDKTITDYILIDAGATDNYTLKINYLNRGYSQNNDMDKYISCVININNVSDYNGDSLSDEEIEDMDDIIENYDGLVGEGSNDSPYLIDNAKDLIYFNYKANSGDNIIGLNEDRELNDINLPALSSKYKITNNIVVNNSLKLNAESNNDSTVYAWKTIGTSSNPFTGTIDGDNHKISGLSIIGENYTGFISYAQNVNLRNFEIKSSYIKGDENVGGFIGYIKATGNNVSSLVNIINSSTIEAHSYVGGIVGCYESNGANINLTITDCVNNGTINVSDSYIGGIIGTIRCFSSSIDINLNILRNINNGDINSNGGIYISGIIGEIYFDMNNGNININYNTNNGNIKGSSNMGGIIGNSAISNDNKEANVNFNYNANNGDIIVNYAYGYDNGGAIGYISKGIYYNINNTINTGDLSNSNNKAGGIIGRIDGGLLISVANSYNTGNITSKGENIGGIIGYSRTAVNIFESYNTGNISGTFSIGGIIGSAYDNDSIYNEIFNTGNITCTKYACGGLIGYGEFSEFKNAYNTGDITFKYDINESTQGFEIGGLVGKCFGKSGIYDDSLISNIYNTGKVSCLNCARNGATAGIIGTATQIFIHNAVNNGTIIGTTFAAGIVGYNSQNTESSYYNDNIYSQGNVSITSSEHASVDEYAFAIIGYTYSSKWRNTYYFDGIAEKITNNDGNSTIDSMSTKKNIITVVNSENKFKADTNNINHGYPIFTWQDSISNE